jgi:outer membrane protein assembly factor BamB
MMLRLKEEGGKMVAERLWKLKAKVFGSEQHTPIYYNGHIYGVRPDGAFVCLDSDGDVLWTSRGRHRFHKGYGPWLVSSHDKGHDNQGMIYALDPGTTQNAKGILVLIEATPEGYRELARAKILDGHDSWGPMALAGGRLLARDLTRMVCLDVSRKE